MVLVALEKMPKRGPTIRKVDANQKEIVDSLRKVGCSVQSLHTIGKGCPDLLVGYRGENTLLEVKVGNAQLTPDEEDWQNQWRGGVTTVTSSEEAIRIVTSD